MLNHQVCPLDLESCNIKEADERMLLRPLHGLLNVLAVGAFTKILEVTKTWIDFGSGKPCNI